MRIAVLGAGVISEQYLTNLVRFPDVEVTFVADLDVERARQRAEQFAIPGWGTPDELLAGDSELVVNLTTPAAHHDTTIAALEAGKHVWLEKPLATTVADAKHVVEEARSRGLEVGCAPDTVLGRAVQTGLRRARDGAAGELAWASAAIATAGPQGWHPAPEFLFSPGGGPLLDMGPYYITVLAHAFGAASRIHAVGATAQPTRVIGSGPRQGTEFPVTTPSTIMVLLEYRSGAKAQALFSFDSGVRRTQLEVTGSLGTIVFADPNRFHGDVEVRSSHGADPEVITIPEQDATRGVGVVEMVRAIADGRRPRANADIAAHVVEVMAGAHESMATGRPVEFVDSFEPVEPLPVDWDPFTHR